EGGDEGLARGLHRGDAGHEPARPAHQAPEQEQGPSALLALGCRDHARLSSIGPGPSSSGKLPGAMGEAAPCYHWIDCRTGAIAARVAWRLSHAEGYPWSDRERWGIRFGLVGRGALYQVEVVGKYHSAAIGWWIREGVPEA